MEQLQLDPSASDEMVGMGVHIHRLREEQVLVYFLKSRSTRPIFCRSVSIFEIESEINCKSSFISWVLLGRKRLSFSVGILVSRLNAVISFFCEFSLSLSWVSAANVTSIFSIFSSITLAFSETGVVK